MKMRTALLCATAVFLSGCAGLNVGRVTNDDTDHGLRFYRNVPYLLVTTNNQGGLTSQVIYLPDTNELLSAHVFSYGAFNETTLKFTNSVLTSATVDVDTTVIPKAVLAAVSTIAPTLNLAGGDKPKQAPGPYLYKIKVHGTKVDLIGSEDVITINIGEVSK